MACVFIRSTSRLSTTRLFCRPSSSNGPATSFAALNTSEYVGTSTTQQVVRYTTNHDVNGSDGTPVALYGGHAGAMSVFVIASCFKEGSHGV